MSDPAPDNPANPNSPNRLPTAASPAPETPAPEKPAGWYARWQAVPLYQRIILGLVLGLVVGVALGASAAPLAIPARLVMRVLGALAPPLILLAVIQALMKVQMERGVAARLAGLLLLNTLVAILIGLAVANVLQPGKWANVPPPQAAEHAEKAAANPVMQFLDNIPKSVLGPLGDDGRVLGVIFLAIAFGIALRQMKDDPVHTVEHVVDVALRALLMILHWIIDIVPIAVFGIVAAIVGEKGFGDFIALGAFVIAVMVALALQSVYYLVRIRFGCWAHPWHVVRGMWDALVMAFSTASSTATMPVTYECLRTKVGISEKSASLGALVGANFNNDGTALYEAMSALFVAQMLGIELTLTQQGIIVLTSVIASVGAAGIPEAGLVTMTIVFKAVVLPDGSHLPTEYIPVLLTVDWFLDRCRTAVNVMGDVNVSCMLEGQTKPAS